MARYNTAPQTLEVTGDQTFTYAFTGGIISLTGTTGYTVTLVSPVFFPGSKQTFFNATDGNITLETAAGQMTGNGVTIGTSLDIPKNSTYVLTSDGTNYVLTSALSGPTTFELPVTFNALLNADGKVELNPLDNNVEIKPTGTGLVDISPQSSVSIQPGAQATIRPTGDLTLSSSTGTVSLGDLGKATSFPGNISFTAADQTVDISPTGASSAVTIDPAGDTIIGAGGTVTITSDTVGAMSNIAIGATNPSTGAFTLLTSPTITATSSGASTSTSSGALIVTGGLGVGGAIYAGSINGAIGGGTAAAGAFTTLSSNSTTSFTGNAAATNTTTGTLRVTGGVGISGAIYAGGIQNTPIGNTSKSSGAFTTLTTNSTVDITGTTEATNATGDTGILRVEGGASIAKKVYSGGGFIGNISGGTGSFTTLTASSTVTLSPGANVTLSPTGSGTVTLAPAGGGSINNMSIGASTASTGKFTTVTTTSNVAITGNLGFTGNGTFGNATGDNHTINGSVTITNGFNHNITGYTRIARGTTAQRGTGVDGAIRYNTSFDVPEFGDGSTWRAMGPGFYYSDVSSNITAAVWNCYFVDTNGGARTITMPGSTGLLKGDTIRFLDLRKTFDSNALTIARASGQEIQGDAANMTVTTEGAAFDLIWHGTTYGWRIFSI
tara:strand:- start:1073 stop:3070 length:1998 start_codon:yes stop_codon:yes gene_type:complete